MRDLPTVRPPSLNRRILSYLKRCVATLPEGLFNGLLLVLVFVLFASDRPWWVKAAGVVFVVIVGGFLRGFVVGSVRNLRRHRSGSWTP